MVITGNSTSLVDDHSG
jgi:hypothetical protein